MAGAHLHSSHFHAMVRAVGGAGRGEMCGTRGENSTFASVLLCAVPLHDVFIYQTRTVTK